MTRRTTTLTASGLVSLALICLALLVPAPYVTMLPGPTYDTLGEARNRPMLEIGDGATTYPTDGELRFTTVSVTSYDSELTFAEALMAWLDDDEAVVPREQIYPEGQTADEAEQETAMQMTTSKRDSQVAALRAAGVDVGEQAVVTGFPDDSSAEGELEVGDVVRSVDGERVRDGDDFYDRVSGAEPGTTLTLGVRREGEDVEAEVETTEAADDPDRSVIGIEYTVDYRFPFTVTNNVGEQIGGPSAGTMFALAIYDELTPGSLTGGRIVAGTGTIDAEGNVGSIGGIQQKIVGADEAGAEVFLVPAENCDEAVAGGDRGLELVEVDTLQTAIDELEALADDPDADVRTCS